MKPPKEDRKDSESRFVLEGNAFYEIDEECVKKRGAAQRRGRFPKRGSSIPRRRQ